MACPALGLVGVLMVAVALQPLMGVLVKVTWFIVERLLALVPRQRATSAPTTTPAAVSPRYHFLGALHSNFRGGVVEFLVLVAQTCRLLFHPDVGLCQVSYNCVIGGD